MSYPPRSATKNETIFFVHVKSKNCQDAIIGVCTGHPMFWPKRKIESRKKNPVSWLPAVAESDKGPITYATFIANGCTT